MIRWGDRFGRRRFGRRIYLRRLSWVLNQTASLGSRGDVITN
jgi:hypothetical protein